MSQTVLPPDLYRAILATVDALVVVLDLQGRIVAFNRACESLTGYAEEEATGRAVFDLFIPPEEVEGVREVFRNLLDLGSSTHENHWLTRSGERRLIRWTSSVLHDAQGRASHVIGTGLDVTEARHAEERLLFTQFSVDHSQEAAFWMDPEAQLVDVNDTACRSLGYRRDELVGMHVWDIDPDFPAELWAPTWEELRRAGAMTLESRHRTKDGRTFPVEVQANYVEFRGKEYDCAFVRDISERKRAEEALRQREDLLRATLDSTAEGILVVDHEGRISTYNPRFVEMWNLPRDVMERAGTRWDLLAAVESELQDPASFRARVEQIDQVQTETRDELHFRDGRVFERVILPLVRGGQSAGMVLSFRDITDGRHAERERRLLEEQLRQSQKMEAVGRLAGGIAHDFNNLLTGIIGYAEVIVSELQPGDPVRADAEEIRNAGARAAQLTSQLLTFSRKQVIVPRVVDLNRVVAESRRMLGRIIGEDIELVFAPGAGLRPVKIDPGQVDQVLVNLATNARDAMPSGGRLAIETRNVEVGADEVRSRPGLQPGRFVLLQVRDNGSGMGEEVREHAFEPFFSTKPKDRGTGLGLSTVYGIVKQNDGFVYIDSAPGRGTTIEVLLRPTAEATAQQALRSGRAVAHGRETVLLVEDEETVRSLASKVLRRHGYEVLAAPDSEAGLRLWREHRDAIGLLVTDVVLPRMNGRALFDRLRAERPDLRALFISGYNDQVVSERGVLAEGFHFLPKPFTVEGLAAKVREVLDA